MGEKTTGEHTNITIAAEDGSSEKLLKAVPVLGGAYTTIDGVVDDGQVSLTDIRGFLVNSATFVQSCMSAVAAYASDPLGWLVDQGLNFLLALFQPLQDALHFVTGDGPALANAAANFANIGKGLQQLAEEIPGETRQKLNQWRGAASEAAHTRMEQFSRGIQGVAGESGNISQLLQVSSMIMTVIEELLKALISELVIWMLFIWPPALAAAVPTGGASVADAMSLSVLRGTKTTREATGHVTKLQGLLNELRVMMSKISEKLAEKGSQGFMASAWERTKDSVLGQVKPGDRYEANSVGPGGITGKQISNADKVATTVQTGYIGEHQSDEQTSDDLDV